MTIAFIHPHRAFLPELDAYRFFFEERGIHTIVLNPGDMRTTHAPVEWHFLGIHRKKNPASAIIHEYGSASVPPFARWKDRFKKMVNVVPDYRIYFSEYVREKFLFNDEVPYGFRDHGVPAPGNLSPAKKEYDFIYVGAIDSRRKLSSLFDCFLNGSLKDRNLLVVSKEYEDLFASLGKPANIIFKGPVTQSAVHQYIRASRFAINFIPDIEPYNHQTAAKFIDYAASATPIITTDYPWVRNFQQREGGDYFYLEKDLSNFTWEKLNDFSYSFPTLKEWTWEHQIRKSGVLDFLNKQFPELNL
jgi:hypothetical protein